MTGFRWANKKHPGITSDYLTFTTSDLGLKLEKEYNNRAKTWPVIMHGYVLNEW